MLFESKERRQQRENEEQLQRQLRDEKMAQEVKERRKKQLEEFTEKVKEYAKGKDICAITTSDDEFKQISLDYMVKECGYICVQNDTCCTKYTVHYVLTFAKPEYASKFGIPN